MIEARQFEIRIENVPVRLRLGVTEDERAIAQEVRIDVALSVAAPGAIRDDLATTVDYDEIVAYLRDGLPALGEIRLIETIAERVAVMALASSPLVTRAEVSVRKPGVLADVAGMVSVTMTRSRPGSPQ